MAVLGVRTAAVAAVAVGATPSPPTPSPSPATGYDEQQALRYAYLSTAAMCSYPATPDDSSLKSWTCGPACEAVPGMTDIFTVNSTADDAFVFGGKLDEKCTVVFRGTSDTAGWIQDLKSATLVPLEGCASSNGTTCQVGSGFLQNYNLLKKGLLSNLAEIGCTKSSPLVIVGHSLGAAEASIARFDLKSAGYAIAPSYTFGQPRVGDAIFNRVYEETFKSVPSYRVTHADDPAVQIPFQSMGFEHMATEVYYQQGMDKGYQVCDGSGEDPSCSAVHAKDFISAGLTCALSRSKCSHLNYFTPTKKILMNQDSCTAANPAVV